MTTNMEHSNFVNAVEPNPPHDGSVSGDYVDYQSPIEGHANAHRQRRRHPAEMNKICRVCGDKALSVNFNVVSCESCKAFFRRNALKKKELRCQTAGACEINVKTRRSCKKCRLRKCFEVGMVKEWIMSDEARLQKRQLIERNREKRRLSARVTSAGDTSEADVASSEADVMTMDYKPMPWITRRRSLARVTSGGDTSEADVMTMDYEPMHCTIPHTPADFSLPNNGQSFPPSVPLQESSPSSFTFQHASTSAFRPPSILPIANSTTPPLYYAMLPTEPAIASSPFAAGALVEDMIRVPKTLLASLISECHGDPVTCPHQREENVRSRPTVIVSNKWTPLRCVCPCRCGARAGRSPREVDKVDKSVEIYHQQEESEHADSDGDSGFEGSPKSDIESSLVCLKKGSNGDVLFNFNIGISSVQLLRLSDLLVAFNYPQRPVGRAQGDKALVPALPLITMQNGTDACGRRTYAMVCRLLRFCKSIAGSSNISKKVLANLMKACCSELVLLHSVLAYSLDSDGWYDEGPNVRPISLGVLKRLYDDVYDAHKEFVISFPRACKDDASVIVILFAIVLFNPGRVDAKQREHVQRMRSFYTGLLINYLDSNFEAEKAHRLQKNILALVENCSKVAKRVTPSFVVELSDTDLEPLLIEILGYR